MERESQGFMYVAKRKCGRVSAMRWDDAGGEKEVAKSLAGWVRRGDTVDRIEVFKGDPMPEWICRPGCADCKVPNVQAQGGCAVLSRSVPWSAVLELYWETRAMNSGERTTLPTKFWTAGMNACAV